MTKLSRAALALAAGLLTTGALAQTAAFEADADSVRVPAELFGPMAVELAFSDAKDFDPKAKLILRQGAAITATTEFSVKYTLDNAVLDEEVSNSDFKWGSWRAASAAAIALTGDGACMDAPEAEDLTMLVFCPLPGEVTVEREGGAKGSDTVTFDVTVTDATALTGLVYPVKTDHDDDEGAATPEQFSDAAQTRKIVLFLPNIEATGEVTVTMDVTQPTTGGTRTTISEHLYCGEGDDAGVSADCDGEVTVVTAHAVLGDPTDEDNKLPAITRTAMDGTISLDDRTKLVLDDDEDALQLAMFTVNSNFPSDLKDANGNDLEKEDGFSGTLAGNMEIYVESQSFRPGDKLKAGTVTMVVSDTTATGTVELSDAMKGVAVTYEPNGKDDLAHRTTFMSHAATLFDDENHKDADSKPAVTSTLKLAGIMDDTAKAYAIAPLDHPDITNVRVTCEVPGTSECRVFIDCKDQSGDDEFYEAGAEIMGGHTEVWTKEEIAGFLGLDAWDGRLACEVLSTKSISVQVLTRSGGSLVNNTYVDET